LLVIVSVLLVSWYNQPELVVSTVDIVLDHLFAVLANSSANIKSLARMRLDQVSLIRPWTLLCSCQLEPATGMFSSVQDRLAHILLVVLVNAKSPLVEGSHKGKFALIGIDIEFLVSLTTVSFY
jgi:hypothetical protein